MKMTLPTIMAAATLAGLAAAAQAHQGGEASTPMARTAEGRQMPMAPGNMTMQGGMMGQMNDPEMRREMTEMMNGCQRMMSRMDAMPAMERHRP